MNNTINNAFINGICNNDHSRDIIAVSDDGREIGFTYDIFELLKTDKTIATIYDANTGEIIYTRDDLTTSTAATLAADAPVATTYTVPARAAETIIDEIIELFKNNDELFTGCIEELDAYNGYLGDDRFYSMDDLPDLLAGYDPIELLNRAYFGNDLDGGYIDADRQIYGSFNPNREYFRFNGYGNLESTNYIDYTDHLDDYAIRAMLENRAYIYSINDNPELNILFDELEQANV